MKTKICGHCKIEKSISNFFVHKRYGFNSWCKICFRENQRLNPNRKSNIKRYRQSKKGKANQSKWQKTRKGREFARRQYLKRKILVMEYQRNYRKQFPEKNNARRILSDYLRNGRLKKEPCRICNGAKFVEAHHFDYSKPLKIVWLCSQCHHDLHFSKLKNKSLSKIQVFV